MRPDDYLKAGNNPARPTSNRPAQRPIQDFRPQNTPRRPIQDFGPPRAPQGPTPQRAPQSQPTRSMKQPMPPTMQAHPQRQQNAPVQTISPTPLPAAQEMPKQKGKILKSKKVLIASVLVAVLAAGIFAFFSTKGDNNKAATNTQKTQVSIKPLEKPDFTTYYPSPLPAGLTITKGSITYYKDSFTFIIEQGGQKSFFVYEQPASTDPDFNSLKSKLAAPKNIALTVGQGVEGGLDNGTITAIKTDKNTIIMINCIKTICSTAPRDIISNMQVNEDLETIKHDNS